MKACNLTKGISYRDMLPLIEDLNQAAVVQAEFATGGGVLLKGREIVEGIARNGKAEHVPVLTITVVNTTQAEIIAAMLQVGSVGGDGAQDRFDAQRCRRDRARTLALRSDHPRS
jgi:hypothetical protein